MAITFAWVQLARQRRLLHGALAICTAIALATPAHTAETNDPSKMMSSQSSSEFQNRGSYNVSSLPGYLPTDIPGLKNLTLKLTYPTTTNANNKKFPWLLMINGFQVSEATGLHRPEAAYNLKTLVAVTCRWDV